MVSEVPHACPLLFSWGIMPQRQCPVTKGASTEASVQCCHLCCAGAPSPSEPLGAQQQASPLPKRKARAHEGGASDEAAAADSGLSAVMGPYGLGANVAWREQVAGTAKLDAAGQSNPHLSLFETASQWGRISSRELGETARSTAAAGQVLSKESPGVVRCHPPGRGSCRWAPESWSGSACMVQVPEGTIASCSCCSAAISLNHPVLVVDMDRNAAGMGGRVRFAGLGQILSLLKPSARMWQLEAPCISRQPST